MDHSDSTVTIMTCSEDLAAQVLSKEDLTDSASVSPLTGEEGRGCPG